jgi:hypothetical protein
MAERAERQRNPNASDPELLEAPSLVRCRRDVLATADDDQVMRGRSTD